MKKLRPVMLGGTGSDVGKSVIATGLCRIFLQDGYCPAPFKAQNMALNSGVTVDGKEMGRAQIVQAEASGIVPTTDMNPILLKPSSDHTSQVVVNGIAVGNKNAYDFYRKEGRESYKQVVRRAFDRLARRFNPIVMEGAGSIAEINLKDTDLVNMSMARYAKAAVILVADIDRGGVFASVYGSIMLQSEEERKLIKGIIINKFRGDINLFDDGKKIIEKLCGVPVLGVVPYMNIKIEEEDSVALEGKSQKAVRGKVNICVIKLAHISNYTDFTPLERIEGVNVYYSDDSCEIKKADIIFLPGSKSTIADLVAIREKRIDKVLQESVEMKKKLWGICGGYQMMGEFIEDPDKTESNNQSIRGLGFLPVKTVISPEKRTVKTSFRLNKESEECKGYEIHMGQSEILGESTPFCLKSDGSPDGVSLFGGLLAGTYIHGLFENKEIVKFLLGDLIDLSNYNLSHIELKEKEYNILACQLRKFINIEQLYNILSENA